MHSINKAHAACKQARESAAPMRVQSINIMDDFDTPDASEDFVVDTPPVTQHHPEDNQIVIKSEKQDSSSMQGEDEKENPINFGDRKGMSLGDDVSVASKNQNAKQIIDSIVIIKGQAHKIRPMSPRSYR